MPGLEADGPEALDLDDIFSFLYDKSVIEPITPFRLAVYFLLRVLTNEHKETGLPQSALTEVSFLMYALLASVNLSFPEFCRAVEEPLKRLCPGLYDYMLERFEEHKNDVEVLVRRDPLFVQLSSRRRRLTGNGTEERNFVENKSLLGIFVRKLALAQRLQTMTELRYSHEQWICWLQDNRPSAKEDLFGGYSAFVSFNYGRPKGFCGPSDAEFIGALAPQFHDIRLNASPIKDRSAYLSEELVSATVASNKFINRPKRLEAADYRRNVFAYEEPPTSVTFGNTRTPGDPEVAFQPALNELLSTCRARTFLDRQIHLLHVSPEEAMSSEQLKAAGEFITSHYAGLTSVHLLMMLNAIRNLNVVEAEEALRQFFDWGAIRTNEILSNGVVRFTSCDARPLRYAPLLLARLARLFNQRERARLLLTEALHHAHANRDLVCLRLCLVEQSAIEADDEIGDTSGETPELEFSPSLLLTIWAPAAAEGTADDEEEDDDDNELQSCAKRDDKDFSKQLDDCETLQKCITMAKKCEDPQKVANGLQTCAGADYGVDRESQARLISEAARSIVGSLKLTNGFVDASVSDSEALLRFNLGDQWCTKYNTEPYVIALVNMVYAHAVNGQFTAALNLLSRIKKRFSLARNQLCALHWMKCECLVEFDKAFLLGEWIDCEKWLEIMITLAPEEADFRKTVYEFTRGDVRQAFDVAAACNEKLSKSKDLRLQIRGKMVLAMIYADRDREHVGRGLLENCLQLAKAHSIDNFVALITRRLAYIDTLEEKFDDALAKITECEWIIRTRSSFLERGHCAMTAYTAHKQQLKVKKLPDTEAESAVRLSLLANARRLYRRASAPLLEKAVLKAATYEYDELKQVESRDDCAVAFLDLNEKYSANINWAIL